MSVKTYLIYCEYCGYRRTTDGTDVQDLIPVKQSDIPGGIPYLDPTTKKIVTPKSRYRPKRFKCPRCGRAVTPRRVSGQGEDHDKKDWTP